MAEAPLVEVKSLSKSFAALRALDGVSLELRRGEVLALLGENGAGKSTLLHILYGLLRADAGEVLVDGRPLALGSPRRSRAAGIGMVHQHFTLVPSLSVAENLALGEGGRSLYWLDRRACEARIHTLAAELGFKLDPRARVATLSVGDQQRAEILKALAPPGVRCLVLDEPTATLTPREASELFTLVRNLRRAGRSIIFVSHKLREVLELSDRVVVLRQGRVVAQRDTAATTATELAGLMVGVKRTRDDDSRPPIEACDRGMPRLEITDLAVAGDDGARPVVNGLDLTVHAGEIVGIAGVDGNGQRELAEALVGLRAITRGQIRLAGSARVRLDPRAAYDLGLAYVPADRRRSGLVAGLSIAENLVLRHYRRPELGHGPLLDRAEVHRYASARMSAFSIRAASPESDVADLSGGNQQRVVLARELAHAPRVLVAENPTRGLDVAATEFVHDQLLAARRDGAAVLLISTDLDEVVALADRLYVMYEGRLSEPPARDPTTLGLYMGGAGATP